MQNDKKSLSEKELVSFLSEATQKSGGKLRVVFFRKDGLPTFSDQQIEETLEAHEEIIEQLPIFARFLHVLGDTVPGFERLKKSAKFWDGIAQEYSGVPDIHSIRWNMAKRTVQEIPILYNLISESIFPYLPALLEELPEFKKHICEDAELHAIVECVLGPHAEKYLGPLSPKATFPTRPRTVYIGLKQKAEEKKL